VVPEDDDLDHGHGRPLFKEGWCSMSGSLLGELRQRQEELDRTNAELFDIAERLLAVLRNRVGDGRQSDLGTQKGKVAAVLREAWPSGLSTSEIAEVADLSESSVRNVLYTDDSHAFLKEQLSPRRIRWYLNDESNQLGGQVETIA